LQAFEKVHLGEELAKEELQPRREAPTPERNTLQPAASTEPQLNQKAHPSTVSHIVKKRKPADKTPVRQSAAPAPTQK